MGLLLSGLSGCPPMRKTAHQVNLCAGCVEDASVPTLIRFIGDIDEAFVDLPDHLRIDGDLLIEGAIFSDGEVVLFKESKNLRRNTDQKSENRVLHQVSFSVNRPPLR